MIDKRCRAVLKTNSIFFEHVLTKFSQKFQFAYGILKIYFVFIRGGTKIEVTVDITAVSD